MRTHLTQLVSLRHRLGVTLDSTLNFDRHFSEIVHSCYFHIRALKHIRAYLSLDTAISVGVCIVAASMDYCNRLLYGTSNRNLDKLQRIQNLIARTVTNASRQRYTYNGRLIGNRMAYQMVATPVTLNDLD